MDAQTLIAKRMARQLGPGMLVNLGIGIPTLAASHLPSGMPIDFRSENGLIDTGPVPQGGPAQARLPDAASRPVSALPGASAFDSAMPFGPIRGGHLDMTVPGGPQVDQCGLPADWMVAGKVVPGMGGAMDLVAGARRVVVAIHHVAKGQPKVVRQCRLPLTSVRAVDLVAADLAAIAFPGGRASLLKTAPGVTVGQVIAVTEAELCVPDTVGTMAVA